MFQKTKTQCFIAIFLTLFCMAQIKTEQYRVDVIEYDLKGKTRPYALSQKVEIDKKRIFPTKKDYELYYKDILQQLNNQRVFDVASIEEKIGETGEDGITSVHWLIHTKDTKNFLMLPYPKYDSNNGFRLKITAKDYNFFGSMNTMSFNSTIAVEEDDDDDETQYKLGGGLSFDLPFKLSIFDSEWQNDYSLDYTLGKSVPEYSLSTGLLFSLPFDTFKLQLTLKQGLTRNTDYEEYGDAIYATESAVFAIPITLVEIVNWGQIIYTPNVSATIYWDQDGIDKDNLDLISPIYSVGHSLSSGRIDWHGNFRQGFSIGMAQSVGFNTLTEQVVVTVNMETQTHLDWKYLGPSMRTYFFANQNGVSKIGDRLRGIRDDQRYDHLEQYKALQVSAGIVFNCDLPIRIVQTDWDGWGLAIFKHIIQPIFHCSDHPNLPAFFDALFYVPKKLFHYCDFELQISPFCDFALTTNRETGDVLNYKDGYYAGGVEVLVFPSRWRSIQVRASAGVDLGRLLLKNKLNTDFRDMSVSKYELYIGLGLMY